MSAYQSSIGRGRVESIVLQGVPDHLAKSFRSSTGLLKYWRDDASHGVVSDISELKAYETVSRLLRFAHLVTNNSAEFTGSPRIG